MFSTRLIELLSRATSVAVLTGAGVSAESGVPTFRDPGGLWSQFRPEELANADAFLRNPDLVWSWYEFRRGIIADVAPNPGHAALAEFETLYSDFTLITQNVDGLHRRAGSRRLLELHGSILHNHCQSCRTPYGGEADDHAHPPRCTACGGLVRPSVVWFGEQLPQQEVREAWDAAARCQVFLSIGTSGEVYPAAQLPTVARNGGAYTVEINPRPSAIARQMHECIEGPSGVVLPALLEDVRRLRLTA
ncbi:MAG: NAD-dependent deacylase [Ignavibacteriae bacterium]|nr:NAD-dependent deacylase [Ignavibacteriota bacterium]